MLTIFNVLIEYDRVYGIMVFYVLSYFLGKGATEFHYCVLCDSFVWYGVTMFSTQLLKKVNQIET